MRKIVNLIMATILVASTAVFAQDKPAEAKKAQIAADPVVIKSGDLQVRKSEFEAALKTIPAEYQAYASGAGKKAFAEDYLRMKLLAREAEKQGLDKRPETIQQLKLMRENALANAQLDSLEKGIQVTDADIQKTYDERKAGYEQAKARHILIAFKGSPAAQPGKKELTEEEAKAKAEEIRAKAMAGTEFAELAKAESDDRGSAARGGELGWFSKGQMVPEFEKAAFETKSGETSPVVRTQYGYHVIKVDEHRTQALADVKAELDRELRQTRMQEKLDALKQAAAPTFDEAYFAVPAPPEAPAAPASTQKPANPGQ